MADSGARRAIHGIDALRPADGRLFFVVGVFDGLHLGHLYLLRHLVAAAAERDARPAVITFDHHPDEILTGAAPALLCDPEERLLRLEEAGVGLTIVQHFDQALRMTSYEDFIRRIAGRVDLAGFLMTPESAFGHERRGTAPTVAALGSLMGYDVVVVPSLDLEGRPVRSAEIRADIAAGDLREAAHLLGRPYAVVGERDPDGGPREASEVPLRFQMPVALPPAGTYPVRVEEATPDGAGQGPATGGSATILGSGVTLRGTTLPPADRLRVTFA
jgi:riboflavin kinase/FMN adenylyltransferase